MVEMGIIYGLSSKTGTLTGYSSLSKRERYGDWKLPCSTTAVKAVT
jgi:hypothetical protein